jgi:hypothetical protein
MEFSLIPADLIKNIITLCPCFQWFVLCKQLNHWATQVISPLDHRQRSDGNAFLWAVKNNKINAVAYLLKDNRIDPSTKDNEAIFIASNIGYHETVKLLLQDPRVDPNARDNQIIRIAIQKRHKEIVGTIHHTPDLQPFFDIQHHLPLQSPYSLLLDTFYFVDLLLQDPRFDPSVDDNAAIQLACSDGFKEEIEHLLQDLGIENIYEDNTTRMASMQRHKEIVELLLQGTH